MSNYSSYTSRIEQLKSMDQSGQNFQQISRFSMIKCYGDRTCMQQLALCSPRITSNQHHM
eukprot:scaffold31256_cov20-Prasinocladus_malaysianus.AAC.1